MPSVSFLWVDAMNKLIALGALVSLFGCIGMAAAAQPDSAKNDTSKPSTFESGLSLRGGQAEVSNQFGDWAVQGFGGHYTSKGEYIPLSLDDGALSTDAGWAAGLGVARRFQVTEGQDFWLYGEAARHEWWQTASDSLTGDTTSRWWQAALGVKLPLAGGQDRWLVDVALMHVLEPDYQAGGPRTFGARPLGADNGLRLRLERNWRFSHAGSLAVGFFGEQWGFQGIDASTLTGTDSSYQTGVSSQGNTAWGADVKYRLRF